MPRFILPRMRRPLLREKILAVDGGFLASGVNQ